MFYENLDRVVIAVKDLEKTIKFFKDFLGVDFDIVGTHEDLKLRGAYSAAGYELVEPYGKGGFVETTLREKGEGIIAMVFKVSDMDAAVERMTKKGLKKTFDITMGKMREVAFHPRDTHGFQIVFAEYPAKHPATVAAWALEKNSK